MLARCVTTLLSLVSAPGCEDAPAPRSITPPITARVAGGATDLASISVGPPCRARIGGYELIAGGLPLVAAVGSARITTQTGTDGLTFLRDGAPVGRLQANQLFAADGELLVAVTAAGAVLDPHGATIAHATVDGEAVTLTSALKGATVVVSSTTDVVLAAMLVARDAGPELQALVACQLALATSATSPGRE